MKPETMEDALEAIYWRDEILQVMYWYRGEGFGEAVTPAELVTFLGADENFLRAQLDRLSGEGYLTCADGGERALRSPRYQLTEWGVKEGGRRFADEFSGLTGQAHGECNNPNCACQTEGPEACESRTTHSHQE